MELPEQLRTTFDNEADAYHRLRPQYPEEIFDTMVRQASLPADAKLLEIGPGTGQATVPMAKRGYDITAIELAPSMAAKAQQVLARYPNARVINNLYEQAELPDKAFDMVYSVTAFHWVNKAVKYTKTHRILKEAGHLAIVETARVSDEQGDEFFYAAQPLYREQVPLSPSAKQPNYQPPTMSDLKPPEVDTELFDVKHFDVFPLTVAYNTEDYIALTNTYSWIQAVPSDKREQFLGDLRQLIDTQFGGTVQRHQAATLTIAQAK